MKVYAIEHDGHYLGGISVVVAESVEDATNRMKDMLKEMKLDPNRGFKVGVIDTTKPNIYVLFNGDY